MSACSPVSRVVWMRQRSSLHASDACRSGCARPRRVPARTFISHSIALHHTPWHFIALYSTSSHFIALYRTSSHFIALEHSCIPITFDPCVFSCSNRASDYGLRTWQLAAATSLACTPESRSSPQTSCRCRHIHGWSQEVARTAQPHKMQQMSTGQSQGK